MLILLLLWRLRVPIHTSDLINEVYLLWHMRVLLEAWQEIRALTYHLLGQIDRIRLLGGGLPPLEGAH